MFRPKQSERRGRPEDPSDARPARAPHIPADRDLLDNAEIADRLDAFAAVLELGDANPYTIRAYRRAAQTVRRPRSRPLSGRRAKYRLRSAAVELVGLVRMSAQVAYR
jgi:hypothetical protein